MNARTKLAIAISEATYGELKDIGRELASMIAGDAQNETPLDLESGDDVADLLHQWAEAVGPTA